MNNWIRFVDRLPTARDADPNGNIELCEDNGKRRVGMWDWIPPHHPNALAYWRANGFCAWRRATVSGEPGE